MLLREVIRTSRRWQSYAMRVAFSFVLIALVVLVWNETAGSATDVAAAGKVGRPLFVGYVAVQLTLAALLAPLLVSLGISEERDEKTLELLAITHLRPWQILGGKVLSRLLILMTIVLGSTPILAIILEMGGVSIREVISATIGTLVVTVLMGFVGGFAGLHTRATLAPMVVSAVYFVPAFLMLPLVYMLATNDPASISHVSPVFAVFMPPSWRSTFLPALVALPTLAVVSRVAVLEFRLMTATESDEKARQRSNDYWAMARHERTTAQGLAIIVLAFPALVALIAIPAAPAPLQTAAGLIWMTLAMAVGSSLYLIAVQRIMRRLGQLLRQPSRRLKVPWRSDLYRRIMAWVWWNPVTWRELATRAHGAFGWLSILMPILWVGFTMIIMIASDFRDRRVLMFCGVLGFCGSLLVTVLTATASVTEERGAGTLSLLAQTTMPSCRIVWGKLVAVSFRSLPLFGAAVLATLAGWPNEISMSPPGPIGPDLWPGLHLMRLAWVAGWATSIWLLFSMVALAVGMLTRPARLAWPVNLLLGTAFFIAPLFLLIWEHDRFPTLVRVVLQPALGHLIDRPAGTPPELLLSTLLYLTLFVVTFVLLSWRWRAISFHGAR